MKWPALPRKWQDWRSTACETACVFGKSFVLAEACVSRTHRQHRRCRPPVLKTGTITGPHALPKFAQKLAQKFREQARGEVRGDVRGKVRWERTPNYLGCATTRRYGFSVFQPPGYFCFA